MKKRKSIDKNDLPGAPTEATFRPMPNMKEGCEEWNCNVCGYGLKHNYDGGHPAPSCQHYVFLSCHNCQYFNA